MLGLRSVSEEPMYTHSRRSRHYRAILEVFQTRAVVECQRYINHIIRGLQMIARLTWLLYITMCVVGVLCTLTSFRCQLRKSEYYAVTSNSSSDGLEFGIVHRTVYKNNTWLHLYAPNTDVQCRGIRGVLSNVTADRHVSVRDWYTVSKKIGDETKVLVYSPFMIHRISTSSVYIVTGNRAVDIMSYYFSFLQAVLCPVVVLCYMCIVGLFNIVVMAVEFIAVKFGVGTKSVRSEYPSNIPVSACLPFITGVTLMVSVVLLSGLYNSTKYLNQYIVVGLPAIMLMCAIACVAFGLNGKKGVYVFGTVSALATAYCAANMFPIVYVIGLPMTYLVMTVAITLAVAVLCARWIGTASAPIKVLFEHRYLVCIAAYLAIHKLGSHLIYHVIRI